MKHPTWYYNKFDLIFGLRNYNQEISFLNSLYHFFGKNVLEIGAGTGNHATEILKYNPESITLIDNDISSIKILNQRFINNDRVRIIHIDGFKSIAKYDLILCLYSLIQQTATTNIILKRIQNLYNQLFIKGSICFELIDYKNHFDIYKSGSESILYQSDESIVKIKSINTDRFIQIIYSGNFGKDKVYYKVNLLKFDIEFIKWELEKKYSTIEISYLDEYKRRLLIKINK